MQSAVPAATSSGGIRHVATAAPLRRIVAAQPATVSKPRGAADGSEGSSARTSSCLLAATAPALLVAGRRCRRKRHGSRASTAASRLYEVTPHKDDCVFGATVSGYDLRAALDDPAATEQLLSDLAEHKLLVFHGQDNLTGDDHIKLSEQLGSLDHGLHRVHPRSEDPRLLRVSNDGEVGFQRAGMSGFHVDGVMLRAPFAVQSMHFLSAVPGGDTFFLDLNTLFSTFPADVQERCRSLWFLSGVGKDLMAGNGQLSLLPLVYKHPKTGAETMCFHLGPSYCLGWLEERPSEDDFGSLIENVMNMNANGRNELDQTLQNLLRGDTGAEFKVLPPRPMQELLRDTIDGMSLETRMKAVRQQRWETGDFALIDNMALAHLPAPGSQAPREEVGLRLFHRTTMVDPNAVIRNARGAQSVLLAGGGSASMASEGCSGDDLGKDAVKDLEAMRIVARALVSAAATDPEGAYVMGAKKPEPEPMEQKSAASAPPPPKETKAKRKSLADKLRKKAAAGMESRAAEAA
eukprot:TRINITY_DN26989_c0_g1_i1.p1 TRINITY_DN26989_c0_g1~~TRINITY_DN26989_c0_g1_i1.p1  ORF type:complete len:520 (-),score=107.25 TRINITY_DN26989_c0_g1_i1:387-1946(-)